MPVTAGMGRRNRSGSIAEAVAFIGRQPSGEARGRCSGVEAQQRMRYTCDMQGWEYMTFDLVKRKNEIEELNRLGREGWEAVAMVSSWGVGWRFVHPIVLLKRPRPNDAEGSPG